MKKIIYVSFLLLFGTCHRNHQVYAQEIKPELKKAIDSTYQALIKTRKVSGLSLAIVDHGKVVYASGYGYADVAKKIPASSQTIYRIGSCTKSFTSLSLMQLKEQGKLNVHDPITNYLNELSIKSRFNKRNQLLISDILTHVSGLPCDVLNGFFCDAPPDINWLIQELNKQYTIFPERYCHAYSNVGFGLLGEAIHRVSGLSYSNYIENNVFQPLKMANSFIIWDSIKGKAFAKGYDGQVEAKDPLIRDQAAGLIHSNVLDMSNYLMMYLSRGEFNGSNLVQAQSIHEMEKNQIADITLPTDEEWGYGLYTTHVTAKKGNDSSIVNIRGHGGDTYLYHADFKYIPELQVGVVLMTNSSQGVTLVNGNKLLKLYLRLKDSTLLVDLPKDTIINQKDTEYIGEEMKGVYNMGDLLIRVSNLDKIVFRQGAAKVKFLRKPGDIKTYRAKATLFYVVPINIKNQEFKFVKHQGELYLKVKFTKSGEEEYLAVKSNATLLQDWVNRCGEYELAGELFKCQNCLFLNYEGVHLKLMVEDGILKMAFAGKTGDTDGMMYLETLDSQTAYGGGIGRGKGETLRVLPNGNLYFSGFEFKKKQ